MPFKEDPQVYFDTEDFAENVRVAGYVMPVIWEEPFTDEDGNVEQSDPHFTVYEGNLTVPFKHGDVVRRESVDPVELYEIRGIEPDGTGMIHVMCKRTYSA